MSSYTLPALDSRLALIASMVPQGTVVADIGTDHGFLPVYLVKQGRCCRAYACDINEKPLDKAKFLISRHGVSDKIEARLTNGLSGLEGTDVDTVIIAGMGGELIATILENGKTLVKKSGVTLLLQPMTRPESLREYLAENGFEITEEHGVKSGKFIYSVIKCVYTGIPQPKTLFHNYVGGLGKSDRTESADYLKRTLDIIKKKTAGLEMSSKESEREQLPAHRQLIQQLEQLIGGTK